MERTSALHSNIAHSDKAAEIDQYKCKSEKCSKLLTYSREYEITFGNRNKSRHAFTKSGSDKAACTYGKQRFTQLIASTVNISKRILPGIYSDHDMSEERRILEQHISKPNHCSGAKYSSKEEYRPRGCQINHRDITDIKDDHGTKVFFGDQDQHKYD